MPKAQSTPRQPRIWLIGLLLIVVTIGSVVFVNLLSRYGEQLEYRRLQALATTAAASLREEDVAALRGVSEDAGTVAFQTVRRHLQRVQAVNPEFRFVYLIRPSRGDQLVFLADAEPEDSKDYSAPGDIYDGEARDILSVFRDGDAMVQEPSHDRWGYWVTGLAPVRDGEGDPLAVLGMDLSAEDWLADKARYRNFALTISALAIALVTAFLIATRAQQRARLQTEAINERLAHELSELARAQYDLRLADTVVRNTAEGVMVLGPDRNIVSINPAFERITGYALAEVIGRHPRMLADQTQGGAELVNEIRAELQARGKWEGVLPARRRDGESYPQETTINLVRNAEGAIQHYAVVFRDATQQQQLEDSLRRLSATDGLTQVANRRSFDETLEREWNRALRDGTALSLMLADIDHFKRYNDRYGHVAGDECLKKVAATLRAQLHRAGDFVARYGGEEFAIILPSTDLQQAADIAERLRLAVLALQIPHLDSTAGTCVTLSIGVTSALPDRVSAGVSLVQAADKALYRAKAGQRNRVVTSDESL